MKSEFLGVFTNLQEQALRDFRLPLWSRWELRSSGLLHSE